MLFSGSACSEFLFRQHEKTNCKVHALSPLALGDWIRRTKRWFILETGDRDNVVLRITPTRKTRTSEWTFWTSLKDFSPANLGAQLAGCAAAALVLLCSSVWSPFENKTWRFVMTPQTEVQIFWLSARELFLSFCSVCQLHGRLNDAPCSGVLQRQTPPSDAHAEASFFHSESSGWCAHNSPTFQGHLLQEKKVLRLQVL